MERYRIVDIDAPEFREEMAREMGEKEARVRRGQQLYAKIKRSSKYYGQGKEGALFEVFVESSPSSSPEVYVVQGGPGGQYRLKDVNLYVVEDGRAMRIS